MVGYKNIKKNRLHYLSRCKVVHIYNVLRMTDQGRARDDTWLAGPGRNRLHRLLLGEPSASGPASQRWGLNAGIFKTPEEGGRYPPPPRSTPPGGSDVLG